jgi:hypothetical protein
MNSIKNNKQMTRTKWAAFITAAAVIMLAIHLVSAASPQKAFATGEEAVSVFIKALKAEDSKELLAILGDEADDLLHSGDPVMDRLRSEIFIKAFDTKHRLEAEGDKLILIIGENEWPFPIPLIKQEQQWIFDTAAGMNEIINRRIGMNEISTIQTLLAIGDAQREYAEKDRDNDGLIEYAQKFRSDAGKKNGLYWETKGDDQISPLGELVARAIKGGYGRTDDSDEPQPYFGYYYRMLTGQDKSAAGGAVDYMVKDNMLGGFAVIAWPAEYGNSGVMTFIVNHDQVVFQKDLGEDTEKEVDKIKLFDPNESWTKAQQ